MGVIIRPETEADFPAVYQLNASAFEQDSEAKLVELLRQSDAYIPELSLVAVLDQTIVGHILFSKIKIRDDEGNKYDSLALAPMAVDPQHQRHGIGAELIRHGLDRARDLRHRSVIVLGHDTYYPKFGFLPAERWKITSPYDVPSNVFMAIELVKDGLKGITGIVEYSKPFNEL